MNINHDIFLSFNVVHKRFVDVPMTSAMIERLPLWRQTGPLGT